jgi:hypothetical protein
MKGRSSFAKATEGRSSFAKATEDRGGEEEAD